MRKILTIAVLMTVGITGQTQAQQTPMTVAVGPIAPIARPAPPLPMVLMLVRNAVSAVNQGNAANNYEAVRALGTQQFQANHTNATLSAAFAQLRSAGLDLAPVLITAPEISEPPVVQPSGVLQVSGVFPTRPIEVPFTVALLEEQGKWRVHALNVGARPVGQTVPPPAAKGAAAKPGTAAPSSAKK